MIEYAQLDQSERIVNVLKQFGNYSDVTKEYVSEKIHQKNCVVALNRDKIIGVIVFSHQVELENELLNEQTVIQKINGMTKKPLCIIQFLVIMPHYQDKEVGGELLRFVFFSSFNRSILTIGKETKTGWENERLLMNEGFQLIDEKKDFWNEKEEKCNVCNETCTCTAKIAIRI